MQKIYTPRQEKMLAPRDYLREVADARNRSNIESVRFVLPRIGVPGYGHFQVKYRIPVLGKNERIEEICSNFDTRQNFSLN